MTVGENFTTLANTLADILPVRNADVQCPCSASVSELPTCQSKDSYLGFSTKTEFCR